MLFSCTYKLIQNRPSKYDVDDFDCLRERFRALNRDERIHARAVI